MTNDTFSPERLLEAMSGMTNAELAEKLGCSRSNITMYLNGSRKPSKMTIQLMALCLGVSPAWLMGLNVDKHLKAPTPKNIVKIAGRDGSFIEKRLTDGQLSALKAMIAQFPDAEDL